ncbi:VCAM1 protein, partial [Syrrhaptes paradoxus]|nr:VCAM1 protein [Syrrhaptes paradoxus]
GRNEKVNVENAAEFMYVLLIAVKAFEMEIIPANRIVAQIGERLILTCNTTGCASPSFSWRTQMDNPLGGTVNNHRMYSTLTMNPVSIVNSHAYVCTVLCGEKEKKEKSIKVELYSFPSDPIIEISPSLVAGEAATVICKIPDVYPSHHLEVLLKKEEQVIHEENFYEDDSTNTETKTVTHSFNPMAEDIGKEITCVARLPLPNMDFEPKERVTSQKLNANFGPQNTIITASPSNFPMEGDPLKLTCVTKSNPQPQIVWSKHLADESIQHLIENDVLSIPHARFTDSGLYICEVINLVTNKSEKATVDIVIQDGPKNTMISVMPATAVKEGETVTMKCTSSGSPAPVISWKKKTATGESEKIFQDATLTIQNIKSQDLGLYECEAYNQFGKEKKAVELLVQVPPQNVTVLVYPSENVKEGETVTITCSTYSNPPSQMVLKKVHQEKEIILPSVNGTFILYNVTKNDTGRYLLDVFNEFGNNIKVIEIAVVGRLEKPDQMIPLIIAFSCVTAIAVPVVAILIYVSRKAKLNGSYSLVKALRLKV